MSSTGAATFSSSVTVNAGSNDGIFSNVTGAVIGLKITQSNAANDALLRMQTNGHFYDLRATSTNALSIDYDGSERLRITSGGVVGIGTSSPSERLTVNGKVLVQNGGDLYIDPNGSSTILASTGARPMYFEVNGANRMVIKSDGKINFGYLPTSSTGLSSGDIWNDGGTLKIV